MTDDQREDAKSHISRSEESREAAEALYKLGLYNDSAARSYYAAFHAASAALIVDGHRFKKHSAIRSTFIRLYVKTARLPRSLGSDLDWLDALRSVGDYGEKKMVTKGEAEKAVDVCTEFAAVVKNYLSSRFQI